MDLELYDLAFAFKKAKLWKKLWDSQLFAVSHTDGSIGYCCVMGRAGEHLALAVYPGPEGMHSYRLMSRAREDMTPLEFKETALSQDCVMVSFQNKADLLEEEREALAAYCAERGISLRGQKACPQFERFRPMRHPWFLEDRKDILRLKEALKAALEVSRRLETMDAPSLGFTEGPPYGREIPLLTAQKQQTTWRSLPLPPPLDIVYPSIDIRDDITLARLKKVKQGKDEWAAGMFMHEEAVTEETTPDGRMVKRPKKAPVFPYLLMMMDNRTGMILGLPMAPEPEEYPKEFGQAVVDLILKQGRPARILVQDDRTQALLRHLCPQIGIQLVRQKSIIKLEEAMSDFSEKFGRDKASDTVGPGAEDQLRQLMEALEKLPSLAELPDAILENLLEMLPLGMLSGKLADRVRTEAKRRGIK